MTLSMLLISLGGSDAPPDANRFPFGAEIEK
jgi:hypothetical protein